MDELRDRLRLLKHLRWQAAVAADGSDGDPATDRLIRLQSAIVAIEAALAEGEPAAAPAMDLSGYEVAQADRPVVLAKPNTVPQPHAVSSVTMQARTAASELPGGFMRRGALMRYPAAHPWFDAWRRAVRSGGYRTRWRPAAR